MRRGRMVSGGMAIVVALAVGAAPALAAGNSAVVQGYPCATAPPPAPGAGAGAGGAKQCRANTAPKAAVAAVTKTVAPKPVAAVSGTLPFTGLQLGVVVLFGVLLVGGGLLLRRTSGGGSPSA